MNITVIGATGMVGSRLVTDAAARGHRVTAAARHPGTHPAPAVTPLAVDAGAPGQLEAALADAHAAILAVRAAPGQEQTIAPLTTAVLDAAGRAGARLLVIGGAGPLRSPHKGDLLVIDDPNYVPIEWRAIADASATQLRTCVQHPNHRWTYLSPPAILEPGTRTGTYRRGTTTLLTEPDGTSRITAEDLAVAALDEIERPGTDRHFTVAQNSTVHAATSTSGVRRG
ncbi:NAD(P)-dependent oxidoreductase [Rhodococcus aetherivorans]|uniref:NAD(P)-dependent oxidoreductase n=1 Tax=Rhodococcus aetherivorans TaxID=191292 RepID=UPI001E3BBD11|nr:NAD(P)H-binding protein [Rhodococcus aetherivorans]UGQ40440.1 NAD(P)H-binding protein [Rhodococcus aetherivorans]